jgi:hypothetical protein
METGAVSRSSNDVLGISAFRSELNSTLPVGHGIGNGRQCPTPTGAGKPPSKYTQAMRHIQDRNSAFQFGTD